MASVLRLGLFILLLGTLAAGISALLGQERQRQAAVERMAVALVAEPPPDAAEALLSLRAQHYRAQRGLLVYGLVAIGCVVALALVPVRIRSVDTPRPALAASELRGLAALAETTATQRAALDQERGARLRSEQDVHLQQILVNRALQDQVRLGRDLHDGLVQTLYATGLLLETAAQQLASGDAEAARAAAGLLERAKVTLNAAIREARGTIGELTPEALADQNLAAALHTVLDLLDAGRRLRHREIVVAPDWPELPAGARVELLQIVREAASNALRHGEATRLDIRLERLADAPSPAPLVLTVQDDGRGSAVESVQRGHGLNNLAARAQSLGGTISFPPRPGPGACVRVEFPVPPEETA